MDDHLQEEGLRGHEVCGDGSEAVCQLGSSNHGKQAENNDENGGREAVAAPTHDGDHGAGNKEHDHQHIAYDADQAGGAASRTIGPFPFLGHVHETARLRDLVAGNLDHDARLSAFEREARGLFVYEGPIAACF